MDRYTADRIFNDADDREEMESLLAREDDIADESWRDDDDECIEDDSWMLDFDLSDEELADIEAEGDGYAAGGWDEQPYDYWE